MMRVLAIDDHHLFTTMMGAVLRPLGFEVEMPALTTLGALAARIETRPQVVVIDRNLGPLGDGESLLPVASKARVPAIVVSGFLDDVVTGRCYALGAQACVPKLDSLDVLLRTIAAVAAGEQVVTDGERYRAIDAWRHWQSEANAAVGPFAQLSPREAVVLRHLMDGRSVKTIAVSSAVSETTVRSQVRGILGKLDVASQLEAVALARRTGWPGAASPTAWDMPAPWAAGNGASPAVG